jgi:methylmalonyl-CoA mutase, N-terminal domain
MYLDQLWVMGQYSGFATPAETNKRFRDLIAAGQTGLSIALDLPTQMGLDSDAALALGEVGKVGVPLDTVDDMIALLDGVPLDQVRQVRTTANAIAPMFTAMFLEALAELGLDPNAFRLILQNDPLKEFIARGTYIFPPAASVSLTVDVIEYFAANLPHWEPVEFCGYHIRDAGGTIVHELAIATADGIEYLDAAVARGVDITSLASSLFLFLSTSVDVFQEASKLRAARRIWAKLLHERYGVPKEDAAINLFVYTLGGALTAQEPHNNIVRIACEALAAVLGGAQTLATSSFDEALGLPTAEAARLGLRTQQILALESGAAAVVDPLGGSGYVEWLTDLLEAEALAAVAEIVEDGGAVRAIESGHFARLLGDAAYQAQREIERGVRPLVGVNVHVADTDPPEVRPFRVDPALERTQQEALETVRARRDKRGVAAALGDVAQAASAARNTVEPLRKAARARATLGEMVSALAGVHGKFEPSRQNNI